MVPEKSSAEPGSVRCAGGGGSGRVVLTTIVEPGPGAVTGGGGSGRVVLTTIVEPGPGAATGAPRGAGGGTVLGATTSCVQAVIAAKATLTASSRRFTTR